MQSLCVVCNVLVGVYEVGVIVFQAGEINKVEVWVLLQKDTEHFLFGHHAEFARQDAFVESLEGGTRFAAGCRLSGVHYCPIGH